MSAIKIIEKFESEVRSYSRSFPVVFESAKGSVIKDVSGKEYIDFFSGAGALNYGHNNPLMQQAVLNHIEKNALIHILDMASVEKCNFLQTFNDVILKPRELSYKIQFPGPTGTNAVEAALKLSRLVTGRQKIISFTNSFHGMTLGALSVTGSRKKRDGAGVSLENSVFMPFENYLGKEVDTLSLLEKMLDDSSSGLDFPAAIIVETIQAEGGINVASKEWLEKLDKIAKKRNIFLIIDDIQVGCGRAGTFFSFEGFDISPDIICLSKSISGYGLPLSLVLIKPELDKWEAGQHNGTFRGNNLAFVTAVEALNFWRDNKFHDMIVKKEQVLVERLEKIIEKYHDMSPEIRGRGLIQGISWSCNPDIAGKIAKEAFVRGLILETSGSRDEVIKIMPPLTIEEKELQRGLDILEESMISILS